MTTNYICEKLFELDTPVGGLLLYPGEIYQVKFPGSKKELINELQNSGWIEANGQTLKKSDYPELYEVIGEVYNNGSENENFFSVPDMRNSLPNWQEENHCLTKNVLDSKNYLLGTDKMVMYFLIKASGKI